MTDPLQNMTQAQLANLTLTQTKNSQQLSGQAWSNWAQKAMNQTLANIQQQATQKAAWGAQQRQFNQDWVERRYMIDGQYMSLQEFMDFIWPEDCADKTFFALKFTKETR